MNRCLILVLALFMGSCELSEAMSTQQDGEPCQHNTNGFGRCNRYELCDASNTCITAGDYCEESVQNTNGFGYCLNEHACTQNRCVRGGLSCDAENLCPDPLTCRNGVCVCGENGGVCGDNQQCCLQNGGYCVNLADNKMSACGVCLAGHENCNELWMDGCEVWIWGNDASNCGACSKQCTGMSVCNGGQCGGTGCSDDERLCFYGASAYCMTPQLMSRINLAACTSCADGFENLDNDWRNGCEHFQR